MKAVFNKALVLALPAMVGMVAAQASAQVFYTVRGLLNDHFHSSERVDFQRVRLNGAKQATVERTLGYKLKDKSYVFYVAHTGDTIDGYALFDHEIGQHELIDFATFFDAKGKVTRVEIVAYREPYGDGVRKKRFRRQFVGRHAKSGYTLGKDIDSVTGATLSARAMSKAVRRAAVLLDHEILEKTPSTAVARR